MSRDQHHSQPDPKSHFQRRPQPGKPAKRRVPRRILPPTPDVPAILAHAADPETDLLAEIEAEIGEGPGSGEQGSSVSGFGSSRVTTTAPLDLTDIKVLRAVLRRHGLRPNKILGQHFLIDRSSLVRVVDAAEISAEDHILEVGAGTGVLTVELAKRAQRVVAVELDQAILPVLRESTTQLPQVEVLPMNLLQVDPSKVFAGAPYKLVANLPYYITALYVTPLSGEPGASLPAGSHGAERGSGAYGGRTWGFEPAGT